MTYESWNCDSPLFPARSYLYHLPPLGVGTQMVESLTGYLCRLAEAHSVPASVLVRRELLPAPLPGARNLG
jgi:TniQ